jgi:hypothetical protein
MELPGAGRQRRHPLLPDEGHQVKPVIRQGKEEQFQPTLYIEPRNGKDESITTKIEAAVNKINENILE